MSFINFYAPKPRLFVDMQAMQRLINWAEPTIEKILPFPVLPNNLLLSSHQQPSMCPSENTGGPFINDIPEDTLWPSLALLHEANDVFDGAESCGFLFVPTDAGSGQTFGAQGYTDPRPPSPARTPMPLESGSSAQLVDFSEKFERPLQPVPLPDMHNLQGERDHELNAPAFTSALASGSFATSGSTFAAVAPSALLLGERRARALQSLRDLDVNVLSDQEVDQLAVMLVNRLRRGQVDSDERPAKGQLLSLPVGHPAVSSVGQLLDAVPSSDESGSILNKRKRDDMDMDENSLSFSNRPSIRVQPIRP